MVKLQGLFASVYLAVVFNASLSFAAPLESESHNPATHYAQRVGRRNLEVVTYNPPGTFETFGDGFPLPSTFAPRPAEDQAIDFVRERLQIERDAIGLNNWHTAGNVSYFYLSQQHDGIKFANAHANVALREGKAVAFGSSFVTPTSITPSSPAISIEDAIATAEEALDGQNTGIETTLEYLVLQDASVVLVHGIFIKSEDQKTFKAYVDAATGEFLSVASLSSEAAYHAVPITKQYPTDGLELIEDPEDLTVSPGGWHHTPNGTTTDTAGNNCISFCSIGFGAITYTNTTRQSEDGLVFDYPFNPALDPRTTQNMDAARTNAFYVVNAAHDVWYKYGFTEEAANFQMDNFGKGGLGNDPVRISVQNRLFFNNALFTTLPDGTPSEMLLFLWDVTRPRRDSSMSNDIIIHEFGHGLTNRLTGGGNTNQCLQAAEARGLGEGWSDALAAWFTQAEEFKDYQLAAWTDGSNGIRRYPHSTDVSTNPLLYSDLTGSTSRPHDIGEVWGNALHNVHSALRDVYGYAPDAQTNADSEGGNTMFLHLLIDALKLQPCNPTYVQARDAWIQADANRYEGRNRCLLWTVFAGKGLGTEARQVQGQYENSFDVPEGC